MARIMGAEVVMTGMSPMIVLTLVEMGREIIGIDAALDLDAGFVLLQDMIRARNSREPEQDGIFRTGSFHAN